MWMLVRVCDCHWDFDQSSCIHSLRPLKSTCREKEEGSECTTSRRAQRSDDSGFLLFPSPEAASEVDSCLRFQRCHHVIIILPSGFSSLQNFSVTGNPQSPNPNQNLTSKLADLMLVGQQVSSWNSCVYALYHMNIECLMYAGHCVSFREYSQSDRNFPTCLQSSNQ